MKKLKGARLKVPKNRGGDERWVLKKARRKVPEGWKLVSWSLGLLTWVAVAVLASQFVFGLVFGAILGILRSGGVIFTSGAETVITGVYSVMSYGVALWLIIWVPPRVAKVLNAKRQAKQGSSLATTKEEVGLSGLLTWTDIGLAPVAYLVATLFAAGLVAIFSNFAWFDAEQVQNVGFSVFMNGGERVIAFLVLVVLAPVVEEVIFRGWLYGKLRSRLSVVPAILLVSVLFGVMHGQWNVGVNVFALSVVLCVLREITGTVYAGILTHMLKNGIAFYLLYIVGM